MLSAAFLLLLAQARVETDVVYSRIGSTEIKMDIYHPAKPVRTPAPAVLVIHGGAWMSGMRTDMAAMARAFADKGVVAVTPSYRLAPASLWPAMLDDVQTAVRFLRANSAKYNIDPKRIGAAGASAGGHLALFLGFRDTRDPNPKEYPEHSSRVSAVFDLFGPTDASLFPQNLDVVFQMVLGKPRAQAAKEMRDASPIHFADEKSAPVFIVQGLSDLLVAPDHSRKLESRLKELKVPVQAVYVEGMGHDVDLRKPAVRDAMDKALTWLVSELSK